MPKSLYLSHSQLVPSSLTSFLHTTVATLYNFFTASIIRNKLECLPAAVPPSLAKYLQPRLGGLRLGAESCKGGTYNQSLKHLTFQVRLLSCPRSVLFRRQSRGLNSPPPRCHSTNLSSSVTRLGEISPLRLLFTEPIFTQTSSCSTHDLFESFKSSLM
jgi:hypothetical protein